MNIFVLYMCYEARKKLRIDWAAKTGKSSGSDADNTDN
jgi:hypothetical protein